MGESRPLDSDLAARVKGNASGGARSPESSSRGGALPDFTEIGARGSIRGAAWPGRTIAASVIYWNRLCGVVTDRARRVAEKAALRGGRAPACGRVVQNGVETGAKGCACVC